jgi:plastocyanin
MAEWKILIKNMKFQDPGPIASGDLVYWRNEDGMDHTATSDDGGKTFDTGLLGEGEESAKFKVSQTTPYHCEEHRGMKATVKVK